MPLERRTEVSAIDVLDRVLDKGIVIDYWARVSLLGIDLLTTIEANVVVASFDTYIRQVEPIASVGRSRAAAPSPATTTPLPGERIEATRSSRQRRPAAGRHRRP